MPATSRRSSSGRWRYPYTGHPEQLPHDKQALAHAITADEILYGGAAGGGKTDWLIAELLRPVWRYGVDVLCLRRTFPQLSQPGGIIDRMLTRIPPEVGKYNATDHVWTFVNGAMLQLGYLAHDSDVTRYMGGEYGVIGWDQLEQFTEWQFRRMRHPLRVSRAHPSYDQMEKDGFVPYMVGTANPGGVGHTWVKGRYIDPAPPEIVWKPRPTEDERTPGTRVFIPAKIDDNPGLRGTAYERNLASLPTDDREALREGNWDIYAGQRFGDFRRDIHVIDPEDYPIPRGGVARAMGIDYGLDAPFCALWGALGPDGLVIVYRELYKAGLTPREQGELILASEAEGERTTERPIMGWLDPSTFSRPPTTKQKPSRPGLPPHGSIAWHYRQAGVSVKKANNDRLAGVAVVSDALRVRADGFPRILIYSTCRDLIRTLPGLPRSQANPEDVDTDAEDHAYDALRYLLLGLGFTPPRSTEQAPPKGDRRNPLRTETSGVRRQAF